MQKWNELWEGACVKTEDIEITGEFADALNTLHAGKNIFLTGKAGTGKSTLVKLFVDEAQERGRNVITAAPTGIAALNVDGYTLHRLFSFPPGVTPESVTSRDYFPRRFHKALAELDVLVIDEVSMVRADLFDALAVALHRYGPHPGRPFGGVQLVLVGDLYQLPPVVRGDETTHFATRYKTPFFFSADTFHPDVFPTHSLTRVFRQASGDRLTHLLNSVREGVLLDGARAELNQRTNPDFEPPEDEFWLTLATTNRIADSRNKRALERLPTKQHTFEGKISGQLDGFETPVPRELNLKVGAQIMLINNDPGDRWANGTLGVIEKIQASGRKPVVTVRTREGDVVEVEPYRWEITRPTTKAGVLTHEPVGAFTQLPMKLAWAVTIHKSQGQTLDRVFVDLSGGTFANGQLYVALSRCTSLNGLVLKRGVLPRDLKTDIRVRRFLNERAREEAAGVALLSALTVGDEGRMHRPRPIEITVITDEGEEATTLLNPTSDLYSAETDFDITNEDVALAPTLHEAWPALAPMLEGRVPIGVDVNRLLGLLDYELKRGGTVEQLPLGVDIPLEMLTAGEIATQSEPTSLGRALGIQEAASRLGLFDVDRATNAGGTPFTQPTAAVGYLQGRREGPSGSRAITVGGSFPPGEGPQAMAEMMRAAWDRQVSPSAETLSRLREAERSLGVTILPEDAESKVPAPSSPEQVLHAGARVCFTGTVTLPDGRELEREDMEDIAWRAGLQVSPNMTKTKTDALVVAQVGTQSRKARDAQRWEKPVISAEEFLRWAGSR